MNICLQYFDDKKCLYCYSKLDERKDQYDLSQTSKRNQDASGRSKGTSRYGRSKGRKVTAGPIAGQVQLLSRPTRQEMVSLRPDAPEFVPSWEK